MKEITNNKLTDANIKFNATDRYKKTACLNTRKEFPDTVHTSHTDTV